MAKYLIQKIFQQSFPEYAASNKLSNAQFKASNAILKCNLASLVQIQVSVPNAVTQKYTTIPAEIGIVLTAKL